MNVMQFCLKKGKFSTLNLWFAYFAQFKISIKGIIMFLDSALDRKILIILDFENGFLPTYLPLWNSKETSDVTFFHCGKVHALFELTIWKSYENFKIFLLIWPDADFILWCHFGIYLKRLAWEIIYVPYSRDNKRFFEIKHGSRISMNQNCDTFSKIV